MSTNDSSKQAIAELCQGGCGFYGSKQNLGYCSKCYREKMAIETAQFDSVVTMTDTPLPDVTLSLDESIRGPAPSMEDRTIVTRTLSEPIEESVPSLTPSSDHDPAMNTLDDTTVRTQPDGEHDEGSIDEDAISTEIASSCGVFERISRSASGSTSTEIVRNPHYERFFRKDWSLANELERAKAVKDISNTTESTSEERPVQKNLKRCFTCNKKAFPIGFKCRCGYIYCDVHRHSSKHDCDYDYKAERPGRFRELTKVAPEKLPKF